MSFGECRAFGEKENLLQISSSSTRLSPPLWTHAAAAQCTLEYVGVFLSFDMPPSS